MLLQLHPGLMIWTIVTFLALVVVLRLFAWKPILAMLEAREKKIRDDIDTAAKNREEAERAVSDIRTQLDQARKEANEIVADARNLAEKAREDIVAQAKTEGTKLIEQAKSEIQLERDKTVQALREQFADLAVKAAGKIIGEELSPEKHNKIISKTIGELN